MILLSGEYPSLLGCISKLSPFCHIWEDRLDATCMEDNCTDFLRSKLIPEWSWE